ncbi:MAG: histidine kinase [Coriobacteriia bacterium]|nr:histidine kinase [Coriobacteriia bacterium]
MTPRRTILFDSLLMFAVTVLAVVAAWVLISASPPRWVLLTSLGGLTLIAMGSVLARWISRPDHLKAMHSDRVLQIANESLSYLRTGLNPQTAGAVCRLALEKTEAAAVAITDTDAILGFAGLGEDHHAVEGPILTRATREAIEMNEHRILDSKADIGCPERTCLLRAAIVVPLEIRGQAVGTLKFYYTTPRLLNETQITMAEGLARLLSTQLELSELDRQTELACRMELKALQAQIHPHFLFNTINTIAMLIRTDPDHARTLLREFAWFYRRTLEASDELIPLATEMEYVRTYLHFEVARFGDRIEVTEEVDPSTLEVLVPAFAVQPVVENAVQHGMRAEGVLHIDIRAHDRGGRIEVEIGDDGVGIRPEDLPRVLEPGFGKGLGIALKNVDDRLQGFYGPGSGLSVSSEPGDGTCVRITIVPDDVVRGGADDAEGSGSR